MSAVSGLRQQLGEAIKTNQRGALILGAYFLGAHFFGGESYFWKSLAVYGAWQLYQIGCQLDYVMINQEMPTARQIDKDLGL